MKDDYHAPMNWYRAAIQNVSLEDEKTENLDPNLNARTVMVVANLDSLHNDMALENMKSYASEMSIVRINSGHWVQIEKKDDVNAALGAFFESINQGSWNHKI